MQLTTYFHDLSPGAQAELNDMREWMFADQNRDLLEMMLVDFKKLYYGILPSLGMDRTMLLRKRPLDKHFFNAQVLIPYIAENLGDLDFLQGLLSDLDAHNPAKWDRKFSLKPSDDLQLFYFRLYTLYGNKRSGREDYLRGFIGDRVEMVCNEAGEKLKKLRFVGQHFLMTRKTWEAPDNLRPSFFAAAGNLAAALPINKTEIKFLDRLTSRICLEVAAHDDIAHAYTSFLLAPVVPVTSGECTARLRFMKNHFDLVTGILDIEPVSAVRTKFIFDDEAVHRNTSIFYNSRADRGINRDSRLDIFNLGNHELAHHLTRVDQSHSLLAQTGPSMRLRVTFNDAMYSDPDDHFGAYQNQYIERLCDTFAVTFLQQLCRTLNIDVDAVMAPAHYKIIEEGACKRLLSDDEIITKEPGDAYRTVRVARLPHGSGAELIYTV